MSNSFFETKGLLMRKKPLSIAMLIASGVLVSSYVQADNLSTAFSDGKILGDFRLRYETNDTDNTATKSAEALTLRSRIGFETAPVYGVSALIEGSKIGRASCRERV